MSDEFDAPRFGGHLVRNWRVFAVCCGVSFTLALAASLMMPKQYSATASLLIDPPAGNDARAATAVSPVYLESLKTYERVAASDTLFGQALKELGVREPGSSASIESLKKRILHVSKPVSTKILEIRVTLRDARKAQALAQYIAEQTVNLSRKLDAQSGSDLAEESRHILKAAQQRLEHAEAGKEALLKAEPMASLESDVANSAEFRATLWADLAKARTDLAEYQAQQKATAKQEVHSSEQEWMARQVAAFGARVEQLAAQEARLSAAIEEKTMLLERRKGRREAIETELRIARTSYEASSTKVNDIVASSVFRGERLHVVDPGIVPERPSSPDIPLNVLAALLLGALFSIAFLAVQFARQGSVARRPEPVYGRR
ncbi:MAG: hypothetical protein NTY38_26390 [Acidobacteria bacterium]|nr:hypothetical protein [Acidobacteriota bacterium]